MPKYEPKPMQRVATETALVVFGVVMIVAVLMWLGP